MFSASVFFGDFDMNHPSQWFDAPSATVGDCNQDITFAGSPRTEYVREEEGKPLIHTKTPDETPF